MTLIFILQNMIDLDSFAFTPALILKRPWTLLTSIFLHADTSHLVFNMFALFIFGSYLERIIPPKDFLVLFLLSGVIGNIGYMITAFDPSIPAVGASGGIYGIIGGLATIRPFAIVYINFVPLPMILAAILWGISEFLGLFTPSYIARGAHLFGLLFGIIYGLYIRRFLNSKRHRFSSYFARGRAIW
jgi:membrane associated rhomboid family serine protease